MNHSSELRSSPEDRPSASSFHSGVPATAVRETVLNPEGRPSSSQGSTSSSPSSPRFVAPADSADTTLWHRLFPVDADPAAADDLEAAAGCELGHFSIEERIGSGGMGAVFRAVDTRLQRVVALKVLSPGHSRDRSAVMRFQNEARAAARLDHENIARVYYIGEDRGLHFIAFEYVTGQNVREVIAHAGRLRVADALNNVLQIAAALRHTAAAGVVHRDIKPSNIIIAANGRAKLVDLGLARKIATDSLGDLTVDGTTLGTFDYISPEQARDPRGVDVRSDIYSLGCTFYHMLTGRPPYSSGTVLQKLLDHQSGHAPDPHSINSDVPPALASICRKMMAGDPRNRYATPEELIRDLAVVAGKIGLRPTAPDAHIWSRPRPAVASRIRPGFIWAGSAAIVVVLAVFVDRLPFGRVPEGSKSPHVKKEEAQKEASALPVKDARERLVNAGSPAPFLDPATASAEPSGTVPATSSADPAQADSTNGLVSEQPLGVSETMTRSVGVGADTDTDASAALPNSVSENAATEVKLADSPPMISDPLMEEAETTGDQVPNGQRQWNDLRNAFSWLWPIVDSAMTPEAPPIPELPAENPASYSTIGSIAPPAVQAANPMIPPFAIESSEGVTTVLPGVDTLAEAIEAAYDGETIKLRFDGPLPGGPLTEPIAISGKRIKLVAGRNGSRLYTPVIEFVSDHAGTANDSAAIAVNAAPSGASRMFVLEGDAAGMEVEGVRFRMSVHDASRAAVGQALFVIAGAGEVTLRDVAITIDSQGWSCSVFDLRRPDDPASEPMRSMMGADEESFAITLVDSFVHGTVDLVTIRHTQAGEITIRNSGIVIEQSLLNVIGGDAPPEERDDVVDVTLSHVTAVLGNPLLRVDLLEHYGYVAPIHIAASDCVFATSEAGQLIFMNGTDGTTFDDILKWIPDRNLFKGFSEYFSVQRPADGSGLDFPSSFPDWQRYWIRKNDADFSEQARAPEQRIAPGDESIQLWENPNVETIQPLEFTPRDLQLNFQVTDVEILATNARSVIGVDPATIPADSVPTESTAAISPR